MKKKQILAWTSILLIALLYLATLVLAFQKHPYTKNLLMAALFCTIVLPALIYAWQLIFRSLKDRKDEASVQEDAQ